MRDDEDDEDEGVTTSVLEMALLLLLMAEDRPLSFQPLTANLVPCEGNTVSHTSLFIHSCTLSPYFTAYSIINCMIIL